MSIRTSPLDRTSRAPGRATRRAPAWALTIFAIGAVLYAALFVSAILGADTEMLAGLTLAPVLIGLTVPIALRIARHDGDPTLVPIVMAAVVAKLIGSGLRYYVAFEVYGNSDSLQYHQAAQILAPNFRRGIFNPNLGPITGTVFIKVFTGAIYAVLGVSRITAFVLFAWIGFLGLVLITRAFKVAVPQGDSRRYTLLVLLLPSLVYWPSAIGKEAWMMLAIGLSVYGIALLLRSRFMGLIPLTLGLLACAIVRPHIGLIIFIGFIFAALVRRVPARTYAAPLLRFAGLIALLVLGLALATQTASFLGQSSLTSESVSATLSRNETQTSDAGSAFAPVVVSNPLDMVPAFVTVFFRPFPYESTNPQSLLAAGEGALLLVIAARSWKRIRAVPRMIRTTPYVAFCVGYVLSFVYAFSSFSNFGILARQRVQALPFLLVFFALPDYRTLPSVAIQREERRARSRPPLTPQRRRARRSRPDSDASATPTIGLTRSLTTGSWSDRDQSPDARSAPNRDAPPGPPPASDQ